MDAIEDFRSTCRPLRCLDSTPFGNFLAPPSCSPLESQP